MQVYNEKQYNDESLEDCRYGIASSKISYMQSRSGGGQNTE